MTDVLEKLDLLQWRDLVLPISSRSVSFSHDKVEHKFSYRNGNLIETTGAKSWTFSYTIPMRQDIDRGPYFNLFVEILPRLVTAMRDKTAGMLRDPIYGEFRCVPTSFSDKVDINKRDGTDVEIEFIHSPEIGDIEEIRTDIPGLRQIESDAGKIDEQAEVVNEQKPFGAAAVTIAEDQRAKDLDRVPNDPPLTDIFSLVAGVGRQIELEGNQFLNSLERYIFQVEKIESSVNALADPTTFSLKRRARRAREAAHRAKDGGKSPFKRIRVVVTDHAQTISAAAAQFGMTVKELLDINPSLAASPEIPAGKQINTFEPEQP